MEKKKKGNPNLGQLGKHITSENAREYQRKSAESRKKNRMFRELLEEEFQKNDTKGRSMHQLALECAEGDLNAIKLAMEILGEKDNTLNIKGEGLNIVVNSQNTAERLEGLIKDENNTDI